MKKYTHIILSCLKGGGIILLFLFCMFFPQITGRAVSEALQRCLTTVVPSLYAMMILSVLIVRSGILSCVPKAAGKLSGTVFGMEGYIMTIFTFSMFAGYPAGTSMLLERYEKKALSKERASVLSGLCFGAGPAFIFGCISGRYYSSPTAGMIVAVSAVSANILLALAVSPLLRKGMDIETGCERRFSLTADMLTESILSGGRSMAVICFTVTAFSVLSVFLDTAGIYEKAGTVLSGLTGFTQETSAALLHGFTDITSAGELPYDDYTLLPFLCALTSFGGICVLFQLNTLIKGRLSFRVILLMRTAAGILSGLICRIITPLFLRHELRAVSFLHVRAFSSPSPVPSFMLMIMTFMLFVSYNGAAERKISS